MLRAAGKSYVEVAAECGYPTRQAAEQALRRFMLKADANVRDEARALYHERMEALLRSLWTAAIDPATALAERAEGDPKPPTQERAVELLLRLLDQMAKADGIYAPLRAEVTGADGGPIEGRIDVMHWTPDEAFMVRYAQVLQEAGLLADDTIDGESRLLGPGEGYPEVEP